VAASNFIQKVFNKFDKLDRSKLKKIMLELSTEKDLYELVFDSMVEGVIVTNRDNKVILINRAMEEFTSIPKHRMYQSDIEACNFDPEIREGLDRALSGIERVIDKEIHLKRTDKTFTLTIIPLLHDDMIEGHIILLVDITEKKMKEIQLRQVESLAALTTLSAGVAHEIKNPLTSIDIHIQLLKREIDRLQRKKSHNLQTLLVIVKEEVDRLNSIVQDFLFAVRPMSMNLGKENVNELITELIQFMKYEIEEADIDVALELENDLAPILIDPKYLKQALLNVFKNSIEAIGEGGLIRIRTYTSGDGDAVIEVADNGKGIPEEVMGKIFEPYFTTRKFGTGLGLVIVYKIVKEFGGDIKVRSEEGSGTTFTITLPVYEKKSKLLTYEESHEGQAVNR
jgi:two-component system, sporulation sensor kinase E